MPKGRSNDLYDLISSLRKNEAGYFKKFSARHAKGGNDYIRLFNALARQKRHNEDAIQRRYRFKNFSRLKNYLYHSVLQAMYNYHCAANSNALLRKYLSDIELLYGKALYSQCQKVLTKAKSIAAQYQKFNVTIDLINWEIRILQASIQLEELRNNTPRFLKENEDAFLKMQNITSYSILYSQIYSLVRKTGPSVNRETDRSYDSIISNKLLRNESSALTAYAKMLFYHIHSVHAFARHRITREIQFSNRLLLHIENTPFLLEEEKERYLIALNNCTHSSIRVNDLERAKQCILKLQVLGVSLEKEADENNLLHRVFARAFILELFLHNRTGAVNEGLKVIVRNEDQLKKYYGKINIANRAELIFRIALSFFMAGEFKKALSWNNRVLTDKKLMQVGQAQAYSLLLNIAIHTELSNYNHALKILPGETARLKLGNVLTEFETKIFDVLATLLTELRKNRKEEKHIYKQAEAELRATLKKDQDELVLYYFDILSWVRSKIENIPLAEAIQAGNRQT